MKNQSVSNLSGGGGPAEPVLSKQSELADDVKSNAKGREPAPVRVSETGRARNWTMPPLRLERECKERPNSATIDNRCVEFDRRESTESTAIIGLRALGRRIAFTMAEILLSLTIIGVVAAITLPSLTGNINERTWNTQRKALYARFSQAIALMPSLNGYGTLTEGDSSTSAVDTAAETFVTAGLSKVLKINNICDSEHLADCGIPSKITAVNGSTPYSAYSQGLPETLYGYNSMFGNFSFNYVGNGGTAFSGNVSAKAFDSKVAAFETANGESIAVYYNPQCQSNMNETSAFYAQTKICANFVYDLNGSKGPNTVGKDIGFITALFPSDSVVVAPMVPSRMAGSGETSTAPLTWERASSYCREQGDDLRMMNREEAIAVFMNNALFGNYNTDYWTSTLLKSSRPWYVRSYNGDVVPHFDGTSGSRSVLCVIR